MKRAWLYAVPFLIGSLLGYVAVRSGEFAARQDAPELRDAAGPQDADRAPPAPDPAASPAAGGGVDDDGAAIVTGAPIWGRIADESGAPVSGVAIQAIPYDDRHRHEESSLEARLREIVRQEQWTAARMRTASSDADGTYRLEGLAAEVRYFVNCTRPGFSIRMEKLQDEIFPGAELNFIAKRVVEVPVEVRFESGNAPELARVHWKSASGSSTTEWTPEKRSIGFEPGNYQFTAEAAPAYYTKPAAVSLSFDAAPPPVTLILEERNLVAGLVLGLRRGERRAEYKVRCCRVSTDPLPQDPIQEANIEHDGCFELLDLDPGDYLLEVRAADRALHSVEAAVARGYSEVTIEVPPQPPAELSVRVYEGDKLCSQEFHEIEFEPLELEHGMLQRRSACHVERQDDGSFGLYFDARPPAVLRVGVDGLGERYFELDPNALAPIEVRFAERALVTIVLDGYEEVAGDFRELWAVVSQPLSLPAGMRLSAHSWTNFPIEAAGNTGPIAAESGEQWFVLIGSGDRHGRHWRGVAGVYRLDLAPGIQELRLPFRGLRTLEVELPAGADVRHCKLEFVDLPGEHEFAQLAGKESQVAAFMVPPGRYRIRLSKHGEMEISVEDDTRIAFTPTRRSE